MKFSLVLAAGMAALASAQSIPQLVSQIPSCAIGCFATIVPKVCPKGVTDYGCQCSHVATLTGDLTPCILKKCGASKGLVVNSIANHICSVYSSEQTGGGSTSKKGGSSPMTTSPAKTTPAKTTKSPAKTPAMHSKNTGPKSFNAAPMATAGPIGAAVAAAIAFAL